MTDHIQKFRLKPAWAFLAMLSAATLGWAQAPATQPSDQALREWVAQLGSDDSQTRARSLDHLMDLKRKDLPALRFAAVALAPLSPGQVSAIRQVVTQVFLAGAGYNIDPDLPGGFLGLHWQQSDLVQESSDGVLVGERIPGFAAFRALQPGDVIMGFPDWPKIRLKSCAQFIDTVHLLEPGETLHLTVLRYGCPIAVSMTLDFSPIDVTEVTIGPWLQQRTALAEDFWNSQFAVIDPSLTARRSAPTRNGLAQTSSTSLEP